MQIESQRRYRRFLIVLVYLVYAMMGIRLGISSGGMPSEREVFYSLALGLVLTQICIVDGRIVGRPLSIFSYWLIFMLYGIAVPICFIRARGIAGLGILAAHFVGVMLAQIISRFVTGLLVYGTVFPAEGF
ncbi:MAG: hypothetical protein PVJ86_01785 [Phycisphaerales bacterium]|jgi:hypothetical protein